MKKLLMRIVLVPLLFPFGLCSVENTEAKEDAGFIALQEAVQQNDLTKTKELLDSGVNPNAKRNSGARLLYEAVAYDATNKNPEMVALLLQYGADPNEKFESKDESSWNPLVISCARGNKGAVKMLLAHGARVNVFDHSNPFSEKNGDVPPIVAVLRGQNPDPKIIDMLVDHGAKIEVKDKWGNSPLCYSLYQKKYLDIFRALIKQGANINGTCGRYGDSILMEAAKVRNQDAVQFLLKKKVRLNTKNDYGDTLLHFVSQAGWEDIASLLLKKKADPNAVGKDKKTPLYCAVESEQPAVVDLLLENGAHVNDANKKRETPIYAAVKNYIDKIVEQHFMPDASAGCAKKDNNPSIVKLLFDHGADVNARDKNKNTPLIEAAYLGYLDMVELLAKIGADLNAKNISGSSPLHEASYQGYVDVVRALLAKGANIHETDKKGNTPLHDVVKRGVNGSLKRINTVLKFKPRMRHEIGVLAAKYCCNREACAVLIGHKANVNAQNKLGDTPLHLAAKSYKKMRGEPAAEIKKEMIELLIANGANPEIKNNEGKTPFDLVPELRDRLKK